MSITQTSTPTANNSTPHRLPNFCAGPAAMPTSVLERAQSELLDWQGRGLSVMEVSHRSKEYMAITDKAEAKLRTLMEIPDNYKVLFLQGGASLQFSAIPLNLLNGGRGDYLTTGAWSGKAIKEAQRYEALGLGKINLVATGKEDNFTTVPAQSEWNVSDDAAYFHYCANETIHGIQIFEPPQVDAPIIADMSSCILSQPIDVSKFGMIYAGAQKNIGPAGLVIAIIRDDLLGQASAWCPMLLNYEHQADKESMSNTPATYSWYLAGLVFDWLEAQGGVAAIGKINQQKADLLYKTIDESSFYHNPVDPQYRSIMNVPFTLADSSLDKVFLEESEKAGLLNLKGHRDVGGMRASIYNAVPLEWVQQLVDFMIAFEKKHA
ncbi:MULTISPECIES: 3-phosphoserine/phosphohydroxythreonine transaminase [Psychrobacter]|uniref:Phosphoserine aminotransferase n=1 Tax=Psychrobacter pacificensis TaxID=112002 RepID=A0A1G6Z4D4_9GAMM|nr:3-phosphoserine/phosphohydroxythreonine transaminase [Psychrobacter pacificensis]MED6315641.1 3-phosphoserine/phosphohydroxythreonine transaminase [Pseudomonadota bacterium]GLR29967.1 phosphoserine aminotransferase [Psychrobacter pacificensis]SDD97624.1 phosphoserine aminotransferase apoenzyme [Psychrobacter pacificensis]